MISFQDQVIIKRGALPGSNGGIYNPGVYEKHGRIFLLCRRELDYQFGHVVLPELLEINPESMNMISHLTLTKRGYPEFGRIEDFRCITFAGKQLAVHTLHTGGRLNQIVTKNYAGCSGNTLNHQDPLLLKPIISEIKDGTLRPYDALDLPIPLQTVEKNWVLFEHQEKLHCIYSLDPLTIFRKESTGQWVLIIEEDNGWSDNMPFFLSNSVNLIAFKSGYLGFWHTIEYGAYVHGAYWLDSQLQLKFKTGILIDGAAVKDGPKPGVIYVSSVMQKDEEILLFYGKADSDTAVMRTSAKTLWDELQRSPFIPGENKRLRIQFSGTSLSGLFKAMQSIERLIKTHPSYQVLLYLNSLEFLKLSKSLASSGLQIRDGQLYKGIYEYHITGEDGTLTKQSL